MYRDDSITQTEFGVIVDIDLSDYDAGEIKQISRIIIVSRHCLSQNGLIRDPTFNDQLQIIHIF